MADAQAHAMTLARAAFMPHDVREQRISRISRLYEVMDLMLDSVGDPLALGSLAASASYSSYHFDRIFRELTGFSAVEYQRKRRLRRAAHLLRHEPDVAVGRIAQDCGFPSNAAFAKAFRQ